MTCLYVENDREIWTENMNVVFESLRAYHVGASFVSLAPTYFISQSALTPLLLLSNCAPLLLGSQLVCRPAGGMFRF